MGAKARIGITVAFGLVLGLATVMNEQSTWPTAGIDEVIRQPLIILAAVSFFLVPFVVARWWVLLAMLGPALALEILQGAGTMVTLDDSTGPAWNYRTVFQLAAFTVILAALVALGVGVRSWRRDRRGRSDDPRPLVPRTRP